jgi:hypothetical protein
MRKLSPDEGGCGEEDEPWGRENRDARASASRKLTDNNGGSQEIGAPPISRVDLAERKTHQRTPGLQPQEIRARKGQIQGGTTGMVWGSYR